MIDAAGCDYQATPVCIDGDIITASGPPASREFAQAIVKATGR